MRKPPWRRCGSSWPEPPAGAGQPAPNSPPALGAALLNAPGNPDASCLLAMPLTTADIGTQLLMDSTVNLQEIEARMTARVFAAVHHPERGPAVRAVLEQLLAVLDATSPDEVI